MNLLDLQQNLSQPQKKLLRELLAAKPSKIKRLVMTVGILSVIPFVLLLSFGIMVYCDSFGWRTSFVSVPLFLPFFLAMMMLIPPFFVTSNAAAQRLQYLRVAALLQQIAAARPTPTAQSDNPSTIQYKAFDNAAV